MENNYISVIIPVYQAEKCIKNCISSLQNQTYKNLQIIMVDDGSTDKSPEILDEIAKKDNRVIVIHQKNQGVSVARNVGIEHASGKFIIFLDADDTLDNKMCELLMDEYRREKSELVISGLVFAYNLKKTYIKSESSVYTKKQLLENFERQGNTFIYQTLMGKLYLSEFIKQCQFEQGVRLGEDLLFNYQYFQNVTKVSVMDYCGYIYNINSSSTTHTFKDGDFEGQFNLREKGINFYRGVLGGAETPKVIERNYVGNILGIIVSLVTTTSIKESYVYLKKYLNNEFFMSKLKVYLPINKKFKLLKIVCLKKCYFGILLLGKINKLRMRFYAN